MKTNNAAPYTVRLSSVGNLDHGQNPKHPMPGVPNEEVVVQSFAEASKACRDYIAVFELGGGNWNGGQVYDAAGQFVGKFSFNGRMWDEAGCEIVIQ